MQFDPETLGALRERHAAWRLLRYEHAATTIGFLHRVFIEPNLRSISQSELIGALDDQLYAKAQSGDTDMPRTASNYLDDWASEQRGWLRRFHPAVADEPHFDLTAAAEQAIRFVTSLTERSFIGTESRLRILFDLLDEMATKSTADPAARLADLESRRAAIDAEIERARRGEIDVLNDRVVRERFQQFVALARELLGDFRQVEQNFRGLDRRTRERIASWDGARGELVGEILGERDSIEHSEEGRSFRAFWEFLMSQDRQDRMSAQLDHVLDLAAVREASTDRRLRRVHYDWLEAGEHTQRTVALLSAQLRRFLDDAAWLEERRIVELLRTVEHQALAIRDQAPLGVFAEMDLPEAELALPFERPLFTPRRSVELSDVIDSLELGEIAIDELFDLTIVDSEALADHISLTLDDRGQATLAELCATRPLTHGLAELVGYLELGSERFTTTVDRDTVDEIRWQIDGVERIARLQRVLFVSSTAPVVHLVSDMK